MCLQYCVELCSIVLCSNMLCNKCVVRVGLCCFCHTKSVTYFGTEDATIANLDSVVDLFIQCE